MVDSDFANLLIGAHGGVARLGTPCIVAIEVEGLKSDLMNFFVMQDAMSIGQ